MEELLNWLKVPEKEVYSFNMNNEINQQEYFEKVVQVNRVSKKTQGGDKRSLSVLVVAGDRRGQVGVGLGKASDVQSAVRKATSYARKHLINVPLVDNRTIPHSILIKRGAAKVILKPARAGTGIIAGGAVRVVVEAVGISDIVSKILGTRNRASNVYATLEALSRLKTRSNKGITDKEGVKEAVKESRTRVVKKVRKAGPANAAA